MAAAAVGAPIIIMISAHGREALVERLREQPAFLDGFLVKPVTASMLFDAVSDAMAGGAAQNSVARQRSASNRLKGLRLLVVEDNVMNQQVAFELLSNEGAQVTVAGNGRLGVRAALSARPPFDAVLMDIQMPDIDGYQATAKIRSPSIHGIDAHHCHDRQCIGRRQGRLPGGRHERSHRQAHRPGRPGHDRPEALPARRAAQLRHAEARSLRPRRTTTQDFRDALRRIGENRVAVCGYVQAVHPQLHDPGRRSAAPHPARGQGRRRRAAAYIAGHRRHGGRHVAGELRGGDWRNNLSWPASTAAVVFSADEFDAVIRQSCNELRIFSETAQLRIPPRPSGA